MKNIIILFGFLFFLLSSCSKANKSILPNRTNSNNDFPVSRKIIGLYKSDTPYSKFLSKSNCSLYFTSSTSIASEALDHPKHAGVYATALDNNNNDIIQNFQVNDIKLTYQNEEVGYKPTGISKDDLNNQLLGLYGHTVSFESYDNYDTLVVNEKLYIPSYIIMQNIYGDIASTIPKLSVGTQIEWNADASNTNGIAIIVTAMDNTNQKSIENVACTE